MPEIIDPVFAKTSQNARFLLSENERFGLVFVKTGSINSGTGDGTRRTVAGRTTGAWTFRGSSSGNSTRGAPTPSSAPPWLTGTP